MNTNVVPESFWFFFELLRDRDLTSEAHIELMHATDTTNASDIDLKALLRQPLLSSIYAEVLRQYVAIMMIRET